MSTSPPFNISLPNILKIIIIVLSIIILVLLFTPIYEGRMLFYLFTKDSRKCSVIMDDYEDHKKNGGTYDDFIINGPWRVKEGKSGYVNSLKLHECKIDENKEPKQYKADGNIYTLNEGGQYVSKAGLS